jgi:hypothetical protein
MTVIRLAIIAATLSAVSTAVHLPDAAGGHINGRIALMFWPATESPGRLVPVPKNDCTVHFVLADDQARESVYPCGEWFQPPVPSRYVHWLEQGDSVSYQSVVGYGGDAFRGKGLIGVDPMFPAGFVAIDPKLKLEADQTFRIVSLKTQGERRMFDRRLSSMQARRATTRVPTGQVVSGIFDSAGRAVALSRPTVIAVGQVVRTAPARPSRGGDALVVVGRDPPMSKTTGCRASVVAGGKEQAPAVSIITKDRLLFIWYGIDPGAASLSVGCGEHRIERLITFVSREIVTFRGELP